MITGQPEEMGGPVRGRRQSPGGKTGERVIGGKKDDAGVAPGDEVLRLGHRLDMGVGVGCPQRRSPQARVWPHSGEGLREVVPSKEHGVGGGDACLKYLWGGLSCSWGVRLRGGIGEAERAAGRWHLKGEVTPKRVLQRNPGRPRSCGVVTAGRGVLCLQEDGNPARDVPLGAAMQGHGVRHRA